jgi:anthranilate synthase component 2
MQPNNPRLLLVDNEDSFTWNLVQLFEEAGAFVAVKHPSVVEIATITGYDGIVISPGPGLPDEMPGLMNIISIVCGKIPLLGVCLGHQAIAMHFGANLFRMKDIVHGRKATIRIIEKENDIFCGLSKDLQVGLYHSWAIDPETLPASIVVSATSEDEIIMAFRHKELPAFGVQFHPESYITAAGRKIAENWIKIVKNWK